MKNVGQRAVVRLAGTYLAIIMSMSVAYYEIGRASCRERV